jgi:hypothetical protein
MREDGHQIEYAAVDGMHEVCELGMQFPHLFIPSGFENRGPHDNASPRSKVLLKM